MILEQRCRAITILNKSAVVKLQRLISLDVASFRHYFLDCLLIAQFAPIGLELVTKSAYSPYFLLYRLEVYDRL